MINDHRSEEGSGVSALEASLSRRAIVKGAVWSVSVIAAAVAVPAAVASGGTQALYDLQVTKVTTPGDPCATNNAGVISNS